jgi:N-acetylmuramoyl-L-alanine amidase/putative methionine-R-sulfoxide reductase with GAF domain
MNRLEMATTTTKPDHDVTTAFTGVSAGINPPAWPRERSGTSGSGQSNQDSEKPSQRDALQALLAFSALHDQVRRRKALAARHNGFDAGAPATEFDQDEQFVLDEVLQLVAERAVAITGADGLAIALAENNEIVLRAAAGAVRPDVGARIDRDSAFSGACFRSAQIVMCDDTETDPRVNLQACRKLGARSMVAVPLCGRRRVIGVLEAFSEWPFGFNDSDVRNLSLLAELVLGALKPEDEDRFAQSAAAAATKLEPTPSPEKPTAAIGPKSIGPAATVSAPIISATIAPVQTVPAPTVPAKSVPPPIQPAKVEPPKVVRAASPVAAAAAQVPVVPSPTVRVPVTAAALNAARAAEPSKGIEKVSPSASPAMLEQPAVEAAPAPNFAIPEADSTQHRPFLLILLVCIVIGAAVAGAVWLKKTAQGSAIIHSETMPLKPTDSAAPKEPPATATSADANPASTANPPDAGSDADEPESAPATPQELSKFPRVTGIRHWTSADSSTVVLDLQDQVQYEAHRLAGPDRVYFDLRDTQLATELIGKSIEVGDAFVGRIRMAQPVAGMTRIVLETRSNSTFSVSLEPNPYRLVVEVRKIGATPKAAVNLFPNAGEAEKNKLAIVVPPPTKEDLQLRARVPKMRIVVDAGHGGWDLGTVGRRGLLEKDLVLEISQRLGKLLESRLGMEVIYTRPDDNYITLDERASIANQSQADLFVSVHANYSDLPSARGVETYYTNFFSAPGSKDLDTHASAGGVKPAVTATLSPADLHERIEQSRRLAASVQRSLYGTLSVQNPGLRDRGIKEAGFVVLTESAMPGILAEVSFVSSPTDEQKLRSDGYREQIAEALYRGIARYAATSHGVKVASAAK